jgi:hypothetical protein
VDRHRFYPYPTSHFNTNPDPDPYPTPNFTYVQNQKFVHSSASLFTKIFLILPYFYLIEMDTDPDPTVYNDADPIGSGSTALIFGPKLYLYSNRWVAK